MIYQNALRSGIYLPLTDKFQVTIRKKVGPAEKYPPAPVYSSLARSSAYSLVRMQDFRQGTRNRGSAKCHIGQIEGEGVLAELGRVARGILCVRNDQADFRAHFDEVWGAYVPQLVADDTTGDSKPCSAHDDVLLDGEFCALLVAALCAEPEK